jgi:hypothetical protein
MTPRSSVDGRRPGVREIILRNVLPIPEELPRVRDIAAFKEKHGDKLKRFRAFVEARCIEVAAIPEGPARAELLRLLNDEMSDAAATLREAMQSRWGRIMFTTLLPLFSTGITLGLTSPEQEMAFLAAGTSFVGAIFQARRECKIVSEQERQPLAFAVFYQERFSRKPV